MSTIKLKIFCFLLISINITKGYPGNPVYLDKFIGSENDYRIIGINKKMIRYRLEPPGGQLDVNYSYIDTTDTTWGAGLKYYIENGEGTYRDLTECTAVQIEIKGDGSFNTFHFELVETKKVGSDEDGETWTSPDVSLSSTDWHSMVIPITHFRRLSDSESRPTIDDYIEGNSVFVPKIARYNVILTGKVQTDTTQYFSLREFKGCDIQPDTVVLPVIDDFELNSTIPYPITFGYALPKVQYSWNIKTLDSTALQICFNPQQGQFSESGCMGGFWTILPEVIDLRNFKNIEFDLFGDGSQNSVRLELVESTSVPADGETWASDLVALGQKKWGSIVLNLDNDFHQLFDRTNKICPEYVDGNRIRNHQFCEYRFIFIGQDLQERKHPVFIDNLHVSGKQGIDQSSYFESFIITEPRFSPYRSELIFKYVLKKSATVILKIYRLTGELVAKISSGSTQSPGITYSLSWNGKNKNGLDLPNGLYLVKVNVTEGNGSEKDGLNHPKFIEIYK